ncbi:hypothetical protein D1007_49570 [Hordeum vulgare]|nr:hypothetical protein D1007_49570 [Hordeum vulgare]
MAETHEEIDCYIELYWADRMEAILEEEEAVEDAERRKRGSGGELKKKRRTTAGVSSSNKEEDEDPVEESGNEDGAAAESIRQAKSDLARKKKTLNAKIARFEGMKKTVEGRKAMTQEDVAAAAAYRAKGEEAHRNKDRKGELAAVIDWIATGDPEAIRISDQWMAENVEDMKLEPKDPTDWAAVQAKDYREFWESLRVGSPISVSWEDITLVQPMRYTDEKPPLHLYPMRTLQVFSVKVAAINEELGWPLGVFGVVAARDSLDQNRNIIFHRERDNCQIIDSEVRIPTRH